MILRRKVVTPTRKWEAVVEDSAPELDEVDEVTTPAVGAEEDVDEDSAPEHCELDEAVAIGCGRTGHTANLLTVSKVF